MGDCTVTRFVNPFGQRSWMIKDGCASNNPAARGLQGILAGGITGALEICLSYPTEYVKTQLQLDEKGARKKYSGVMDCVRKTVKNRGIFGLYRGLSVLIYGSIPKVGTRFGTFEYVSSTLCSDGSKLSLSKHFLSGLIAGCCEAVVAVTPMETIKVRLINDQRSISPQFRGFVHGVTTIVQKEGFGGIYKGLAPTVWKQSSSQGVRFFVMAVLKDLYTGKNDSKSVPKPLLGIFGIIAGGLSVFVNTPLDVVKTRMQSSEAYRYNGTCHCIRTIWNNEGYLSFYKGTYPRLGRVCLDACFTFMVYDIFMNFINEHWPR